MTIDKHLPWVEFFEEHGLDMFTLFFKLTFYGPDVQFSVFNTPINSTILNFDHKIEDHDNLCWILSEIKRTESQINYVVNNIMLK